jgi:NADH-quinone oxidoreductase subunit A
MNDYFPILLVVCIATGFSLLFIVLSKILGPSKPTPGKLTTYECGVPSRGNTKVRFFVRFYVVALLFLLFDLETVFLVPWALNFRSFVAMGAGLKLFLAMTAFFVLLVVGLLYEWKKGALEWE